VRLRCERARLLTHAGKLHFAWRVQGSVEFRTRGGCLAAGSNEFFKQALPDAVEPSDFRPICLSPPPLGPRARTRPRGVG
jgi:hypothetical protein